MGGNGNGRRPRGEEMVSGCNHLGLDIPGLMANTHILSRLSGDWLASSALLYQLIQATPLELRWISSVAHMWLRLCCVIKGGSLDFVALCKFLEALAVILR